MRAYIANKMTGIPQFNIPWFDAAAEHLRGLGHDVVSPAELDTAATREAALASEDGSMGSGVVNGETWGDFLARDVKLIADGGIEAVIVGPDWASSKGARLETFVATQLGLPVLHYPDLMPVSRVQLAQAWGVSPLMRATVPM
jgi:hypothetical protein